jgi:hypothetical protein
MGWKTRKNLTKYTHSWLWRWRVKNDTFTTVQCLSQKIEIPLISHPYYPCFRSINFQTWSLNIKVFKTNQVLPKWYLTTIKYKECIICILTNYQTFSIWKEAVIKVIRYLLIYLLLVLSCFPYKLNQIPK